MNIVMKRVRLKDGTEVRRVTEKLADELIKAGEHVYATRTEWKEDGRK